LEAKINFIVQIARGGLVLYSGSRGGGGKLREEVKKRRRGRGNLERRASKKIRVSAIAKEPPYQVLVDSHVKT